MHRSKKYREVSQLVDHSKLYSLQEACELVKKTSTTKFDASVGISLKLNVDMKQANQQVRGTLILPNGNGKTKRVLAITNKVEEATKAGADYVGGKEMLEKIKNENWFDYDVIVATPDMMGELGKMGRLLGPKGLMPNPKTGTVSNDIAKAISEIKAGKVEYRCDRDGNMHIAFAKVSFDVDKMVENLQTIVSTIVRVRPAAVKGVYLSNAVIHSTMGPGIKITFDGLGR